MAQHFEHSGLGRRSFLKVAGGCILMHPSASAAVHFFQASEKTTKGGSLHEAKQSRIKIAQVKVVPQKGQLDSNHRLLMEVLGEIAKVPEVDVVITPEGFLDGYVSTEDKVTATDMVRYAVDLKTSSYVQAVTAWARQQHSWFVLGCTRFENACAYNTAVIINRQGELVGTYDKLHLQQHDHKYTPGGHLSVYDSDFGLFGVMICADRRWPETVRTLALKGARLILNPTYGMHNDLNLAMMRTRAYESELFIAFTHPKQALITGPEGEVITNDEDPKHRYVVSLVDLSAVDARRTSSSGHLKDRRPELYKP
jgi:beta-ureidopropionase